MIREAYMKKLVIKSLLKFIKMRERKQLVLEGCKAHLNQVNMRSMFHLWKKEAEKQADYRRYQLKIYAKMDKFRLKQALKSWFNQIDILRKWRFLNDNTDQWYVRKLKKRIIKLWRQEIRLKKIFFKVADKHLHKETHRWLFKM